MQNIPGHSLPPCSEEALGDALFHYTTADGLIGIFQNKELWNTAYYCANDESELITGKGVLTPLFKKKSHELEKGNDPRVNTFRQRGTNIRDFAENFEQQIIALALSSLSAYITCFCKPSREEDFHHGLLSHTDQPDCVCLIGARRRSAPRLGTGGHICFTSSYFFHS
jgi:hypothetical protein